MNIEQVLPEAFYDSLYLANKLDDSLDGFKVEELYLFSYFSSILFLYKQNPLSDWRYKFTTDTSGYPYSVDLNSAIQRHILNGLFGMEGGFYTITSRGTKELERFKGLEILANRNEFLDAACTTTIMVPYSQTIRALLGDPVISKNQTLLGERWLDQGDTYQKFKDLSLAIGVPSDDLVISAVTWVNYISEIERRSNKQSGEQDA